MMLPRKKLDIGWSDLLSGFASCLRPGDAAALQRRIEQRWCASEALVCLSVRTGFDLLLQALTLPRGSEVLISAVTIRDMVRIIEEHGLVPVPVDMDMRTLSLDMDSLRRACSGRSRALVVAHLFGSRMPLDDVASFARSRNLFLIEDCAQAYAGHGYYGHIASDAAMFSFGPIKTNTALGGGILSIRDPQVLRRMRSIHADYPLQTRGWLLKRLFKGAAVKLLLTQTGMTIFVAACRRQGKRHDDILSAAMRGFPGRDLFSKIRMRPCYPLLSLLQRKLERFNPSTIRERQMAATSVSRRMPHICRPGSDNTMHTHWVYPIRSANPDGLMQHLWDLGLDATRGASSLYVVAAPDSASHLEPRNARHAMSQVLYLPVYPEAPERDLSRLVQAVTAFEAISLLDGADLLRPITPLDRSRADAPS